MRVAKQNDKKIIRLIEKECMEAIRSNDEITQEYLVRKINTVIYNNGDSSISRTPVKRLLKNKFIDIDYETTQTSTQLDYTGTESQEKIITTRFRMSITCFKIAMRAMHERGLIDFKLRDELYFYVKKAMYKTVRRKTQYAHIFLKLRDVKQAESIKRGLCCEFNDKYEDIIFHSNIEGDTIVIYTIYRENIQNYIRKSRNIENYVDRKGILGKVCEFIKGLSDDDFKMIFARIYKNIP